MSLLVSLTCAAALAQEPRIDSVSPPEGPIVGGTVVTIRGTNFDAATIRLDRISVAPLFRTNDEVRLQMPRHDNGYVVISATNNSAAAYGEFLYVPPQIEDLTPGFITTVAGIGLFARDYGPARKATLSPEGIAIDKHDNLYIAEPGFDKVVRVSSAGTIEPFAGCGTTDADAGDPRDGGPATNAQLSFPHSVAIDDVGNVYVPDNHYRIRKVSAATGIISTIAGTGKCCASGDGGPAVLAQMGVPSFLAADRDDLFFIDWEAMRIRRIHFATGIISNFAGNGIPGFSGDGGPASEASINVGFNADFGALALDSEGNVYLGDYGNERLRKIDRRTGVITTVIDHVAIRALAIAPSGKIYFGNGGRIIEASANGTITRTWASQGESLEDGATTDQSYFNEAGGIALDSAGRLLFSDGSVGRIRRLELNTSKLETIAGSGPDVLGDGGRAIASLVGANGIDFTSSGDLIVADGNHVRKIDRAGNIVTIGGSGLVRPPKENLPALQVTLFAQQLEVTADGGIDLADGTNVNRIDPAGIYRFVVANGRGTCGYSGDGGPAKTADVCQVFGTARDSRGNLFVADTNNNRIRRVDAATGIISTFAGNGSPLGSQEHFGAGSFCGDGGPAFTACLNSPTGVAFDGNDNLFIADASNDRIRRVDRNGVITTFASSGTSTVSSDKIAYLYAHYGDRLVRFDDTGLQSIIAGGSQPQGFGGDGGPALAARLNRGAGYPGIAIDADGNLFFSDPQNRRIRAIRYGAVLPPPNATIALSVSGAAVRATVRDPSGRPAPSVRVEFDTPLSGPSLILSKEFAITDANGIAAVSATPNCVAGTFMITARPVASATTASVSVSNAGGPCRRRAARH